MSEVANKIQQLLILGRGDSGRLGYMLDLLKKGRILPESDQKYLQFLISVYLGSNESDSYQKNIESTVEKLHQEILNLNEKVEKFEKNGFERYVGRKAVLFFITVFVGWNALQSYVYQGLAVFMPADVTQYLFPLKTAFGYYDPNLVWFVFIMILLAWPFIGLIHLVKFIQSKKRIR